jgi:hypothetical protein
MKSLLLTSVVIGAGIAIGIAGMNAVGGVAYQVATTYTEIQQAKDPIYINQQNELRLTKLIDSITKDRHDDYQHCMDIFGSEAGVNPDFGKHVGKCAAQQGWDNAEASDMQQQFKTIMRAKIRQWWIGDHDWLERHLAEADKQNLAY